MMIILHFFSEIKVFLFLYCNKFEIGPRADPLADDIYSQSAKIIVYSLHLFLWSVVNCG